MNPPEIINSEEFLKVMRQITDTNAQYILIYRDNAQKIFLSSNITDRRDICRKLRAIIQVFDPDTPERN